MKSSQILKKARKLIETGETGFICCAVVEVVGVQNPKGRRILQFISDNLHPHYTLGQWVESKVNTDIYDEFDYDERIRQTRLNWIDWMIAAYKAKGD